LLIDAIKETIALRTSASEIAPDVDAILYETVSAFVSVVAVTSNSTLAIAST
jgi:hypothetical protein